MAAWGSFNSSIRQVIGCHRYRSAPSFALLPHQGHNWSYSDIVTLRKSDGKRSFVITIVRHSQPCVAELAGKCPQGILNLLTCRRVVTASMR